MTRPNIPLSLPPRPRIRVVAPSGPVPAQRLEQGLAVLRRRFDADIVMGEHVYGQNGYLSGSDQERLDDLQLALTDPDCDAVWCARGGYGLTRLLARLDPSTLSARPRPIVGFSDVTALLSWALARANVTSIHGPVVTQLASLHPSDQDRVVDMLSGERVNDLCADQGTVISGGTVEGRLVCGNLEILRSLVGTKHLPPLAGTIVAFEEVGERPYRIDRTLTQLIDSGALRGVRGIVVGQLQGCDEPETGYPDAPTPELVVIERLARLGIPVVTGLPFGHDRRYNAALPFGTRVRLDADNCALQCLDPPCRPRSACN